MSTTHPMLACPVVSLVPRLTPGSSFAGRFRVLEYIGQGSMGSVYRVEPLCGGEPVALKLVGLDVTADGRALRRFEREVETGSKLRSPYVAAILESGKLDERLAWLTMEFAPGVGLERVLGGRLASRELGLKLLGQLFQALAAAHAEGIVHRDLKPENIRVSGEGEAAQLKVLDFGIAKHQDSASLSLTAPGLGTPLWAAPELSRAGVKPTPSADVWSLGLLSFFVLTGHLYWRHASERASVADLALELLRAEIAPPSLRAAELGLNVAWPPGFDAWFTRAVHRDPGARFRSAGEAWAELEPLLSEPAVTQQLANVASSLPRAPPIVVSGRFLTVVILSCIGTGLAIYWLLRSMRI
jgi:serine/threonine protein kinase